MNDEDLRAFLQRIERRVDTVAWAILIQLVLTAILFAKTFGVTFG